MRLRKGSVMMLCGVLAASVLSPSPASAGGVDIVVNETEDEFNSDSDCSLREAVRSANDNTGYDDCTGGQDMDRIVVPAGTFALDAGALHLSDPVVIEGAGRSETIIQRDLQAADQRVLETDADITVLRALTIAHGTSGSFGGGIANGTGDLFLESMILRNNSAAEGGGLKSFGYVGIEDSIIKNNVSTSNGGGIHAEGILEMERTTLSGNDAAQGGGAYLTGTSGHIEASTFSNNTADTSGGGISVAGSVTFILENSTLSSNRAQGAGSSAGGLYNAGAATLDNVTITRNKADGQGSGLLSDGYVYTDMAISNSIISNNPTIDGSDPQANCAIGTEDASDGFNLENGTSCEFTSPNDLPPADPRLHPLGSYGGPTKTHALKPNSPALDRGDPAEPSPSGGCQPDDQRGVPRPMDGPDPNKEARCDVGAFELRMIRHPRVVSFDLARHLRSSGRVSVPDGFKACRKGVRVLVQRKTAHGWNTVADPRTSRRGRYSSDLPDEEGKYRGKLEASKLVKGDIHICRSQTSDVLRHRH